MRKPWMRIGVSASALMLAGGVAAATAGGAPIPAGDPGTGNDASTGTDASTGGADRSGLGTAGGGSVVDHRRDRAEDHGTPAHDVRHRERGRSPAQVRHRPAARAAPGTAVAGARQHATRPDVSAGPHARAQRQILALVNEDRRRSGCGGISLDRRLSDAAGEHAADMARRDYFAHESPDGEGSGDRMRAAGYDWRRYGENIARGADSPRDVVDSWMRSPEHRANILDCRLHQMGVGLAIAGDHTAYWVQDFATPMT